MDTRPKEVTIKRDVDIKVYDVSCKCGEDLSFEAEADNEGDLRIKVNKHTCIQNE